MYTVIEFTKDIPKTIAVIPINWFVDEHRKSCFWPPDHDVTPLVKARAAVVVGQKNGWQKHGVKQIGKYDTADYDEACRWCRRSDVTLDLQAGLETPKRATRKTARKVTDSEPESDDDDDADDPRWSAKRTKKTTNKKTQERRLRSSGTSDSMLPHIATKRDTEDQDCQSVLAPYLLSSTPQPAPSASTLTFTTMNYSEAVDVGLQHAIGIVNHSSAFLDDGIQVTELIDTSTMAQAAATENFVSSTRVEQLLAALLTSIDEMKRGQQNILYTVQEIRRTQQLQSIQLRAMNGSGSEAVAADADANADVDLPQMLQIPFQTLEELKAGDERLSNTVVADNLVKTLVAIGGMNLHQIVQRMMQCLMTHNVECCLSLTRPPNGKSAFKPMRLYSLIIRAIRCNRQTQDATEAEIELYLSKYLIGTRDRNQKRQQRRRAAAAALAAEGATGTVLTNDL